jgi:hypothetical protein
MCFHCVGMAVPLVTFSSTSPDRPTPSTHDHSPTTLHFARTLVRSAPHMRRSPACHSSSCPSISTHRSWAPQLADFLLQVRRVHVCALIWCEPHSYFSLHARRVATPPLRSDRVSLHDAACAARSQSQFLFVRRSLLERQHSCHTRPAAHTPAAHTVGVICVHMCACCLFSLASSRSVARKPNCIPIYILFSVTCTVHVIVLC